MTFPRTLCRNYMCSMSLPHIGNYRHDPPNEQGHQPWSWWFWDRLLLHLLAHRQTIFWKIVHPLLWPPNWHHFTKTRTNGPTTKKRYDTNTRCLPPYIAQNFPIVTIGKVLRNRLKPLIPLFVYDDQIGFLSRRSISENFLYAVNLLNCCHHSKAPSLVIKLDFRKACDSLITILAKKKVSLENGETGLKTCCIQPQT